MIKITKESMVQCQWCNSSFEAELWDKETYSECTSREMRREFRSVTENKSWNKNNEFYYKCPKCGMWSGGSQLLLLDKNNNQVKGIGGHPIIKFVPTQDKQNEEE